ncbi:MAG: translation initiation factor IF-2 subunit beta [Candidatus Thermoplasmatota archaeon]
MSDYKELLKKVMDNVSNKKGSSDRFKLPDPEIVYEGNTTIIKNFDKISNAVNRDPDQILKYLLGNLGTAGDIQGGRAVFKGKIPDGQIRKKITNYLETFVLCPECGRPDTHLVKKDRLVLIRCDACGAFRSTKSRKKERIKKEGKKLEEGETYTVTIKDIGRKGDGVAYYDKYRIYVSGAMKGSEVKIRIQKISGNLAFAKIV